LTIGVLQEAQTSAGSPTVGSISIAFGSAITAGSAIHVFGAHGNGSSPTPTFSDNNGNTWPGNALDLVNDTVGGIKLFHQVLQNANAGATTVTLTFTASSSSFPCIWVREIGQATTTGNPDGHNSVTNASTTSQNLTCTSTVQPALISALSCNANTQEVPVKDASFTAGLIGPGWNFGGGTSSTITCHKRVTATGTQSVTNTQALADALTTLMAVFDEVAGAVVFVPYQPQYQRGPVMAQ
jgi:hypothetical protein